MSEAGTSPSGFLIAKRIRLAPSRCGPCKPASDLNLADRTLPSAPSRSEAASFACPSGRTSSTRSSSLDFSHEFLHIRVAHVHVRTETLVLAVVVPDTRGRTLGDDRAAGTRSSVLCKIFDALCLNQTYFPRTSPSSGKDVGLLDAGL